MLLVLALPVRAEVGEAKIKAAYLYNFTLFVDWPVLERDTSKSPLRVCVASLDEVASFLGELSNREVKGRPLQVVSIGERFSELPRCHMVFIGTSLEKRLPQMLENLPGDGVLTVSDIPEFSRRGGMIGFVREGGRIRIEINQRLIRQANLRTSAKLLEVARLIE